MSVLSDPIRAALHAEFMAALSRRLEILGGLTKADLRAALNAIDQWVDDNKTAFNNAIPQPAKSALTAAQKAELLSIVVAQRFAEGS